MKTKLTLNIEEEVIRNAKALSKKRKQSISAIVEEYLLKATMTNSKSNTPKEESFVAMFRKKYPAKKGIAADYKAEWHEHLDEKYGK